MEIKNQEYSIKYDNSKHTVICKGSMRLNGMQEYAPISNFLNSVIEQEPARIILNVEQLNFLNSSGVSVLSKFVIKVRNKKNIEMTVIGCEELPWQKKSLKNLQRLMPSLNLELI